MISDKQVCDMRDAIVWLEPFQSADQSVIGGKGVGLLRLVEMALRVPLGFVVPTAAYKSAVSLELRQRISEKVSGIPIGASVEDVEHLAAEVRAALLAGTVDHAGTAAIKQAYRELGERSGIASPAVAVRSSSAAEDSETKSFAGEHDTYLWVVGEDEVLKTVRQCWASLYTARAITYRRGTTVAANPMMAVVVQQMIAARAAGVMMTLNPANGDRSKLMIEVVFGLGEPLVAGEVDPDRFLIDKISGDVIRKDIALKPTRRVRDPASGRGVVTEPVPPEDQEVPSLTDDEIDQLIWIGRLIEVQSGRPQDIEFATVDSTIYVLQSRPETTWTRKPQRVIGLPERAIDQVVSTLTRFGQNQTKAAP